MAAIKKEDVLKALGMEKIEDKTKAEAFDALFASQDEGLAGAGKGDDEAAAVAEKMFEAKIKEDLAKAEAEKAAKRKEFDDYFAVNKSKIGRVFKLEGSDDLIKAIKDNGLNYDLGTAKVLTMLGERMKFDNGATGGEIKKDEIKTSIIDDIASDIEKRRAK